MPELKKIAFAGVFLIFFLLTLYLIKPFLSNMDVFLNFNANLFGDSLQDFILGTFFIILSALSFVIFVAVSQDWKLISITSACAALLSLIPFSGGFSASDVVLAVVIFIALFLIALSTFSKMQSYLTFQASILLTPELRNAATLILLAFTAGYLFTTFTLIQKNGFEIPDSVVNSSISSFNPNELQQQLNEVEQAQNLPIQQIPPDQSLVKNTIKQTLQNYIKPYQNFIPFLLAFLFFSTYSFLFWIPSFFYSPLIGGIFSILKTSNVITIKKEMKEVERLEV